MLKRAVVKYIFVLFSLLAMCGAEFAGLRPCGAGYAAALVYCGLPALLVLPAYILFSLLFDFSLVSAAYAAAVSVASFIAAMLGGRFPRAKRALWALFLAAAHSTLLLARNRIGYLLPWAWGILALGVFTAGVCFFRPVFGQKLKYKFLETELVCGGALLICATLGLGALRVYGFDAAYLLSAFFIPFAAGGGSLSGAVAVGICFGSGIALYGGTAAPIAFMAFTALITAVFAAAPRPIAALSAATAYVLISYLFSAPPSWQQTLCFTLGALSFAILPQSVLRKVRDTLFTPVTAAAARGIIGRTAADTGNNLLGASRIFADMQLAMQQVPPADAVPAVLEKQVCADCPRYAECSSAAGYRAALSTMERSSAAKGRASVSEIPAFLSRCAHLSALVSAATEAAQARHEQILIGEAKQEGRKIVAQQLGLMSGVLRQIGERVKTPVRFDSVKEKQIAEELSYRGVAVPEVIVTDDAVSVVCDDDVSRDTVTETVSKIMRCPYVFVRGGADVLPGYTLSVFARAPKYEVAFSVAGVAKEGKSGDNHSFVRLGGDRFMMALCDGMGSGEEAEKASETAIELVESFFKAGLDSLSAVECVNRFLALNECERFSTLDITVIDLNSGKAEIIKLSSPATVIRSASGVRAVSGASLPMGVFENVTCGHASTELRAGDAVIMATDGVTDALGSTERFVSAAAVQTVTDPQVAAKNILDAAVAMQNGKLKDDGTVLCARIFEKA